MARTILFGFDPDTNEPLDSRLVVDTLAERDALNPQVIYEGMVVYVKETTFQYTLINLNPLDWDIYAGPTGPQGPQGIQGDTGNTGPSGPRGLQGDQGDQGEQGETGSQGEAGPTGNAGADGSIGGRGPMGATGLKGDDGAQGPMGNTGATGAKGDDGDSITGPKGDTGADGAKGDTGADGTVGPKGDTGDQGERGIDGQTGDTGPKGDTGEMGASGIGLMPFGTSFPIPDPDVDIEFRTFNLTATYQGNPPGIYLVKDGTYQLIGDTGGGGGVVEYDNVLDIPIQRNRLVNIFTVTGTRGNVVPAGANAEFATITIRNDYIPGDDGSFTFIPDVTFQAYGFNALFSQVFTGSNLTEYITQIGNEAAGLSELITWDGVITTSLLNGEPASSITLDMGVTTPINSAFSVTGTNPEATVTNQSTGGTPPTSITIFLGEVEVFSFNASALGVNDNNINFVGTTAATGINNITQFPVNWQAEYQNNVNQQEIVITSDVAGPQPVWSFVVNNNGVTGNNAGDIGFTGPTFDTVQANLIDIITFPDGTFQTTAATSGGSGDLFVNITKGGTFLMSDGTKLPSGTDATDNRGNSDARYNTVIYGGTTYYWIQEVGLPKASIIRTGNITDGAIAASKTY